MTKKKITRVTLSKNANDFNRSFTAIVKFIDKMDDKEVEKYF